MPQNTPDSQNRILQDPPFIDSWMFRKKEEIPSLLYAFYTMTFFIIVTGQLFNFPMIWLYILILVFIAIWIENSSLKGKALKLTRDQIPDLYDSFDAMCKRLNMTGVNLYILQNPFYNAYSFGIFKKTVVFHSALVEDFSKEEIEWVMAHELGHLKAGHNLVSAFIPRVPASGGYVEQLIYALVQLFFGFYHRNCEYTSDRCALVLTKDPVTGVKAMMKLMAGSVVAKKIDYSSFASQIKEARGFSVWFAELQASHPFPTKRINHILKFSKEVLVKKN